MSIEIIIGVIAGGLGVGAYLWQSVRNPRGLTFPMIGFAIISIGLWAAYGFVTNQPIMWIPNTIMVICLVYDAGIKLLKKN